ncbi:MAG: hypothetical protein OHK0040_10150 [bacterium]
MIIQCDKCLSKFKLDDSKVTPQGVKVKCKKCSNIFVVFPEKPKEEEFKLDFLEEEPKAKPDLEAPKVTKVEEKSDLGLPSFEMSLEQREEEKKSEEFVLKKEEKEEFSWDQFNLDLGEKKETEVKEKVVKEEKEPALAFDFEGFGEVSLKKEEEQPKVVEKEETKEEIELDFDFEKFTKETAPSSLEEPVASKTLEEFVFEESKAETEELKEEKPKEEFSFEFELPGQQQEEPQKEESPQVTEEAKPSDDIFPPSFDMKFDIEPEFQESKEDVGEKFLGDFVQSVEQKEEIEQVTDKPASDEFEFVTPNLEEEKGFEFPMQEEEKIESKGEEFVQQPLDFEALKPERSWLTYIVAVLIVVLLSGTGVGLIWWQKTKLLETEGNFGLTAVKSEFFESKTLDKVFVVKGSVVNGYRVPKSFIKIKATIKSKDNKVLATKIVFAGNIFSESEIKELTYPEIEKGLNNKMGKSMMNVDIPPGKSLPFMVVFDKVPQEAANIEVESL